jgi:hypothetical protein
MTYETIDEWDSGETMKPDGKVRMPEGIELTVYKFDSPYADEADAALRALERNIPPKAPSDNIQQ